MSVLLDIRDLKISFGAAEAVRGISLEVEEGEVLGLVGESGSGKSATSLAILGLLGAAARVSGEILWRGGAGGVVRFPTQSAEGRGMGGARGFVEESSATDLLRLGPGAMRRLRGREIAMIFQEPMTALNPVMTIGRQVAESYAAHAPSWTGREAKRRAIVALEAVAIPDAAERYGDYPHQFSGGQRQRIMIAMALINKPRLLIADEPTTALDVTVQAQVLELLKGLQRQHGLAMLFISHDLAVVGEMASRVAVMRGGQVVETGSTAQILTAPVHPYTRSLLAAVPTLRTERNQPLAMVVDSSADGAILSP
jgi:peptide/nickel transport system ATP-binding protein